MLMFSGARPSQIAGFNHHVHVHQGVANESFSSISARSLSGTTSLASTMLGEKGATLGRLGLPGVESNGIQEKLPFCAFVVEQATNITCVIRRISMGYFFPYSRQLGYTYVRGTTKWFPFYQNAHTQSKLA